MAAPLTITVRVLDWWVSGNYLFMCFEVEGKTDFTVVKIK